MNSFSREIDGLAHIATQETATEILGPCGIAWVTQIMLTGACVSVLISYVSGPLYPSDSRTVKCLIWAVSLTNLASAGIGWEETWHYLVSQKRDFDTLNSYTSADCIAQLPQGLVAMVVQIYLSHRASKLFTKAFTRMLVFAVMLFAIVVAWIFCIISIVQSFQSRRGGPTPDFNVNVSVAGWLWISAAVDMTITGFLYFKLKAQILGIKDVTDSVLVKIIRLAIMTALPTTVMAVSGAVISSISTSRNSSLADVSIPFIAPLPSLYTLALLATLNARNRLRADLSSRSRSFVTPKVPTTRLPETSYASSEGTIRSSHQGSLSVSVSVEMSTHRSEQENDMIKEDEDPTRGAERV